MLKHVSNLSFCCKRLGSYVDDTFYSIHMEYIQGGVSFASITDTDSIRFYIGELVIALEEIHNFGVLHGNICVDNVLLDSAGHVKVISFGSATLVEDKSNKLNFAHDWYCLGVLLVNMLNIDVLPDSECYTEHQNPATDTLDLILGLVNSDPKERMKFVVNVKYHSYFKTINWEQLRRRELTPTHMVKQQNKLRHQYAITKIQEHPGCSKNAPTDAIKYIIEAILPFSFGSFDLLPSLMKVSLYFPNELKCERVLERIRIMCGFFSNYQATEHNSICDDALDNVLLVVLHVCKIGDAADNLVIKWILEHGQVIVKLVGHLLCNSRRINHVNLSAELFGLFVVVATRKKIDCNLGITPKAFIQMIRTKDYGDVGFWEVCWL